MTKGLKQLLVSARSTLRGVDTTRQLAIGTTFGMLLGIMPKDTAFVILFALILLLSHGNLLAGVISAIAFSWIGWCLEPATHAVGLSVLSIEFLQPYFADFPKHAIGTMVQN